MKGKCPKCGAIYYGWALHNPLHQKCERCGNNLEISTIEKCTDNYQPVFSYPEYRIMRDRMKEAMTINQKEKRTMALKGVCPKCGRTYYGWALGNPDNQRCEKCKCELVITNDWMPQHKENSPDTKQDENSEKEQLKRLLTAPVDSSEWEEGH